MLTSNELIEILIIYKNLLKLSKCNFKNDLYIILYIYLYYEIVQISMFIKNIVNKKCNIKTDKGTIIDYKCMIQNHRLTLNTRLADNLNMYHRSRCIWISITLIFFCDNFKLQLPHSYCLETYWLITRRFGFNFRIQNRDWFEFWTQLTSLFTNILWKLKVLN